MQDGSFGPEGAAGAGAKTWHPGNRQRKVPVGALPPLRPRQLLECAGIGADDGPHNAPWTIAWSESFLFAGVTALLLLLANFFAQWWFLSLIALTPFLYRITKAGLGESLRLGSLLGLAFLSVSFANQLLADPLPVLAKLSCGTVLFTLFSWLLCRVRTAFGFDPIVTALIWVGFELAVIQLGFAKGLFCEAELSSPYLNSLMLLFGFIIISFVIVLLNSLIVIVVEKAVSLVKARETALSEGRRVWDLCFSPGLSVQNCYLIPEVRGPPITAVHVISAE